MKLLFLTILSANLLTASAYPQGGVANLGTDELKTSRTWEISVKYPNEPCSRNPDSRYDRKVLLGQFADALRSATPSFAEYKSFGGFRVENERPMEFFVRDLTDPSNHDNHSRGCIDLVDKHLYHFAARYFPFSLSHIAFLEDGKLKVFRAINCPRSKDQLANVIEYVSSRIQPEQRQEVLERLRNYRRLGEYHTVDDLWIRCEEFLAEQEKTERTTVKSR